MHKFTSLWLPLCTVFETACFVFAYCVLRIARPTLGVDGRCVLRIAPCATHFGCGCTLGIASLARVPIWVCGFLDYCACARPDVLLPQYASITGTVLLQQKAIPPRPSPGPSAYDGQLVLFNAPTGLSQTRNALSQYGDVTSCELLPSLVDRANDGSGRLRGCTRPTPSSALRLTPRRSEWRRCCSDAARVGTCVPSEVGYNLITCTKSLYIATTTRRRRCSRPSQHWASTARGTRRTTTATAQVEA